MCEMCAKRDALAQKRNERKRLLTERAQRLGGISKARRTRQNPNGFGQKYCQLFHMAVYQRAVILRVDSVGLPLALRCGIVRSSLRPLEVQAEIVRKQYSRPANMFQRGNAVGQIPMVVVPEVTGKP
jgi:hypothetical protein